MKRIAVFLLLAILSASLTIPAYGQRISVEENARQSRKAAKKQEKMLKKSNKKQRKAAKKYEKAQKKAIKKAQRQHAS